jgi:hypothetical protein
MNTSGNGSTTSGKSTAKKKDVWKIIESMERAVVVLDPHSKSLAWGLAELMVAHGMEDRLIVVFHPKWHRG